MAPLYPQAFVGSIFMGGASGWGRRPPPQLARMQSRGYVFVNGEEDFNLDEGRRVSREFGDAGLAHVTLIEVPGLGHVPPDAAILARAIDYLDAPPSRSRGDGGGGQAAPKPRLDCAPGRIGGSSSSASNRYSPQRSPGGPADAPASSTAARPARIRRHAYHATAPTAATARILPMRIAVLPSRTGRKRAAAAVTGA